MGADGTMTQTSMQRKYRGRYDNPKPKTQFQSVKDFLRRELADGKRVHKRDLEIKAREEGIPTYPFADAKTELGIEGIKSEERPGQVLWVLPDAPPVATVAKEATVDPNRTHHTHEDQFSLTVEERKMYGIRDDEQVTWQRDPAYWKGKVPGDPIRMFQRENPGGRVIYHNGETVGNDVDVILCVRPMSEVEKARTRDQERANDLARQQAKQLRDDDFNKDDDARIRAQMEHNSRENMASGLIGPASPSSGMAYEDYVRNRGLSKADIEREELSFSLGNIYSREISDDQAEEMMAASRRAGGRGQGTSGKTYSLPPTIRPRNLAPR